MLLWGAPKILKIWTGFILALFVAVFFMHTFIAHDHPHEVHSQGINFFIHSIADEKIVAITLGAALFFVLGLFAFLRTPLRLLSSVRVIIYQDEPNILRRLFQRGILHTRVH